MYLPIWENKYKERTKSSTCSYNFLKLFTSKREYLTQFVGLRLCVCLQNPAGVNGFTMPTYVCVFQKDEYVKSGLLLQLYLSDSGVVSEFKGPVPDQKLMPPAGVWRRNDVALTAWSCGREWLYHTYICVCVFQKGEYVRYGLISQLYLSDPGVASAFKRPLPDLKLMPQAGVWHRNVIALTSIRRRHVA